MILFKAGQLSSTLFEVNETTGKPVFKVDDDERPGRFIVLKSLGEAPKQLVLNGKLSPDHLVSTWLPIHADLEIGDAGASTVVITPLYIDAKLDPVVIGSSGCGSAAETMQIHELRIGQTFSLDLHQEHALIPRAKALEYLAGSRDTAAKLALAEWVESSEHGWYASGQPVLAWHQQFQG
jgi:hypothetical protein